MVSRNFLRPSTFLWCFKLETGGFFIGSVGLFCAVFQIFANTILILLLLIAQDFCAQKFYNWLGFGEFTTEINYNLQKAKNYTHEAVKNATNIDIDCSNYEKIPFGIILLISICFNVISIIAHYRLVKGVEESDSSRLPLTITFYKFFILLKFVFLIILGVLTVFSYQIIYPLIVTFLILLSDLYVYTVIDTIRYKYDNASELGVLNSKHNGVKTKKRESIRIDTIDDLHQGIQEKRKYEVNEMKIVEAKEKV
nr:transmembrane protein LIL1 [Polypedilum vanderplanki]